MQALAMIDMAAQKPEGVAPAKGQGKSEQSFGKVFNASQGAQSARDFDPKEQTELERLPLKEDPGGENVQDAVPVITANDIAVREDTLLADTSVSVPQGKVQQALMSVMKNIGQQHSDEVTVEDFELLVNDFVQQLDQADLHGEQVLAGVDLSALTKELDAFKGQENQTVQLQDLADELKEQLVAVISGTENITEEETLVSAPQQQRGQSLQQPVVEEMNLAQMRQVFQQAIDVVTARQQRVVEASTVDTDPGTEQPATEAGAQLFNNVDEDVDPRFAGLLKPRGDIGLRQQKQAGNEQPRAMFNASHPLVAQKQSDSAVQTMPEETVVQNFSAETELSSGSSAKQMQMMDSLIQQTMRHQQPQGQVVPQNVDAVRVMPQTPVIQLASGQAVAESQIFDQVVTHISGSFNGESGRMVLRLQPAELGSLKLEMKIEGDRIQANFHAQNQQVQEVLERNLPQLRSALAEQGLKIDQFQVNIDRQQQGGQFENLAQQQQGQNSRKQPAWQSDMMEVDEQVVPLAHLMQNGGGGISLHV